MGDVHADFVVWHGKGGDHGSDREESTLLPLNTCCIIFFRLVLRKKKMPTRTK